MDREIPKSDASVSEFKSSHILDGLGEEVTIKVEPVEVEAENNQDEADKSSQMRVSQITPPVYPTMVSVTTGRFSEEISSQSFDQENMKWTSRIRTPFEKFRDQILNDLRVEFPHASEELRFRVAARRWSMLTEEQRRSFGAEGVPSDKRAANGAAGKLRGVHYDVNGEIEEQAAVSDDLNKEAAKYGRCTWCKKYGSLNDYSSSLQGREIYCTGLCSKRCFEQAALKIINVEAGYGLENTVYPENVPIRTNINIESIRNEQLMAREGLFANQAQPLNDITRHRPEDTRVPVETIRGSETPRTPSTISTSSLSLRNAGMAKVPNWNAESSRTVPAGDLMRQSNTEASYSRAENMFDWAVYLKRTGSVAAPSSCFKQQRVPSPNSFRTGMKLEVKDPLQDTVVCIGTVVAVVGPRLRINLDGCSKSEDVWVLQDSASIHPVGWCEGNGGTLQKPKGFSVDAVSYTEFIQKSLCNAELAPMSAFKTEPTAPRENKFFVGMKLEAVDKKNSSVIGVATVMEVDKDRIRIEFDGFRGAGYWARFLDRDLFYAGWCNANGYPLQPPGTTVTRTEPIVPNYETPESGYSPSLRERRANQLMSGHGEVDVHINSGCNPGPYLDANKVSLIPALYKGNIGIILKSILEDLIRCAFEPKTVFGFLKPGRGNIVISAAADGMMYNCYLPNVDRVSTFWKVMEQFCDNLRCCTNMISGFELQTTCPQCGRTTHVKRSSSLKRSHIVANKSSDNDGSVCVSSTPDSTGANTNDVTDRKIETNDSRKRRRTNLIVSQMGTSPRSWSIDDVTNVIANTDLKDYTHLFKENDIDGRALLLLKRDIVIDYMGLKIGPAVKLLDLIDELTEIDNLFG